MSLGEGTVDLGGTYDSTYGYLTAGHAVVGQSHSGLDIDSYAVYLQAGYEYFFYVSGFSTPSPPNRDAYLALYTPGGTLLEISDTTGSAETLLFEPVVSGFYDVSVMSGGGYGSYYLSYSNLTATDDHDASFSTSTELNAATPVFGRLESANDSDGFILNLVAGQRYYFESLSTIKNMFVQVVDAWGNTVGDVVDAASSGTFIANASETVMLLISSDNFRNTGSYYLYAGATYSNTANLVMGGAGNDVLAGTSGSDELQGSWGADKLRGGKGSDFLFGGPGEDKDTLDGGAGSDLMVGGPGSDTYIVDNKGDRVYEAGKATAIGSAGGTDLVQSSVYFKLGSYVEKLTLTGSDAINGTGNSASNTIIGNGARNTLQGGAGNDRLDGRGGNDVLVGGAGRDALTGGSGRDIFDFNNRAETGPTAWDTIIDFTRGARGSGDRIDLSDIDANLSTSGNNAFRFIGSAAFSSRNAAGQLRYVYDRDTGDGMLYGSTDADKAAEFAILVRDTPALFAADFML